MHECLTILVFLLGYTHFSHISFSCSHKQQGNIRFLVLLDLHRPFYTAAVTNNDQAEIDRICHDIVEQICNGCVPPGTFKEWIVDEQEDDYGDLGDDTGAFGSEGGWDDLGCGKAAQILVLRGLRNAPVTSEFDILPKGNLHRESMDSVGMIEEIQTAAAAVTIADESSAAYLSDDIGGDNEEDIASAAKGRNEKKQKKSFVKKMFGKKGNRNGSLRNSAPASTSKSSAAQIAKANAPPSQSISAGDKRLRTHRSASDSESIRAYAKQTRRRRSSGLQAYSEQDPIPKSDITRSDVFLHSSKRRCSLDTDGLDTDEIKKGEDTLGLSKANRNRAGNRRMNFLIDMYHKSYETVKSDPKKRASIVAEVAATIYRGTNEPGRFLKEDPETGMYREVCCERAMITIEHLLCTSDKRK